MKTLTLPELIISLILLCTLAGVMLLYRKIRALGRFQKKFFAGKTGADLEEVIIDQGKQIQKQTQDLKTLSQANRIVAEMQQLSLQHVGIFRFNSFADLGGNNSFAVAILDAHGNGFVLSSLYGRDTCRTYLKPIEHGQSKIPLTEEEKKAILESRYMPVEYNSIVQ
ncbi:MAG: hypothetical protein A2722_04460 [Candidatus Doudnabacteria bacterium RIFCSPHIGHO2_01_FULL_50_11]|uniref:DUF4446 domain-containing protein n=1 Tax=Candidatus Doudnabacteria bacterium RIFCSPHIGHO2_01_FULL_50_11 TaxID=1817828 RepID=A0A1F5PGD2_9BACT|nr:MAG: hypothetical protein A2722_04460 [Candidatus Doudnabacteria bacterium RIFCSPHIGHO2_01_FULL_50_11]HLC44486.1 DUF4446 family protein [Patescibacteria group bacterium]